MEAQLYGASLSYPSRAARLMLEHKDVEYIWVKLVPGWHAFQVGLAEDGRMTAAQLVDMVMASEHVDVVRESVAWLVAELMEAEITQQLGAAHGERAPERRTSQLNGYRPRAWLDSCPARR